MGYWDKKKVKLFPEIKDWTDPQNNIRTKNMHDQTQKEWFWFSRDCYKLNYYGNSIISIGIFTLLAVYFIKIGISFLGVILIFMSLYLIMDLIKKIKNRQQIKDMTFYDLYMREY